MVPGVGRGAPCGCGWRRVRVMAGAVMSAMQGAWREVTPGVADERCGRDVASGVGEQWRSRHGAP